MLLKAKIGEINCCPDVTPLIMTALDVPIFTPRACRSSSDPPHVPVIKKHPATVLLHEMGPDSFTWYSRSRRKNSCSSPVVPHHFLCLSVAQQPRQTNAFSPDGIYSWTCGAFTSQTSPFWTTVMKRVSTLTYDGMSCPKSSRRSRGAFHGTPEKDT